MDSVSQLSIQVSLKKPQHFLFKPDFHAGAEPEPSEKCGAAFSGLCVMRHRAMKRCAGFDSYTFVVYPVCRVQIITSLLPELRLRNHIHSGLRDPIPQ